MLIDSHCHVNMMIKKEFDVLLPPGSLERAQVIMQQAAAADVTRVINVGTSIAECHNCIAIAHHCPHAYAVVGLHPNDCTGNWRTDLNEIKKLLKNKNINKIIGIGETGIDLHYPDYNLKRQQDAFRAQVELALEHDLPLVVHTRQAPDETLEILDEYGNQINKCIIHCFSEDRAFADHCIAQGYVLGIGGAITYPKNNDLREIFKNIPLEHIILETDAPFLPPQNIRGKQNHPREIRTIAQFLADLREQPFELIAKQTTGTVEKLFNFDMA